MMVKGNNHTIERNTIWATSADNFENDFGDGAPSLDQRDMAVFSWDNFGTCQCTDTICIDQSATCCVPGDYETWENYHSRIYQNGMDGMVGSIGGTEAVPSTAAVDALFSVQLSANNSAGGFYEQLRDRND